MVSCDNRRSIGPLHPLRPRLPSSHRDFPRAIPLRAAPPSPSLSLLPPHTRILLSTRGGALRWASQQTFMAEHSSRGTPSPHPERNSGPHARRCCSVRETGVVTCPRAAFLLQFGTPVVRFCFFECLHLCCRYCSTCFIGHHEVGRCSASWCSINVRAN